MTQKDKYFIIKGINLNSLEFLIAHLNLMR